MKKIGFLSFGHWAPSSQSQTRSASDALLQSIELAVAAEELGADGAYFRVHHFARQLASPFPLLAAVGAKTSRIRRARRLSQINLPIITATAAHNNRHESAFGAKAPMAQSMGLASFLRLLPKAPNHV
jgi:Luciferase-like monooxygenase